MALIGQAKTDYQREYMRKRRAGSNAELVSVRPKPDLVRPKRSGLVRPAGLSGNQWAYMQMKAEEAAAKCRVDEAENRAG